MLVNILKPNLYFNSLILNPCDINYDYLNKMNVQENLRAGFWSLLCNPEVVWIETHTIELKATLI